MQRMLIRVLFCAAFAAVTVVVVSDAQAGHRRRGGCGSSGGSYNGYTYAYSGGKYGYTYGGAYGGRYSSGYRGVPGVRYGNMYETPQTGVIGGQVSPSDRTAPAASGTIRGGADTAPSLRGNSITPREASPPAAPTPRAPSPAPPAPESALPPPAPET